MMTARSPHPGLRQRGRQRGRTARRGGIVLGCFLLATSMLAAPASAASRPGASSTATGHLPGRLLSVVAADAGAGAGAGAGASESYRLNTDRLSAGLVQLRLRNAGSVAHQLQLVRLHSGVTAASYRAALLTSHGAVALVLADAAGGLAAIEPGGYQSGAVALRPGAYVALCFQTGGDAGAPHFVHGMFASLTVAGADAAVVAPRDTTGTVRAFSFGFALPAVVDEDNQYRVVNTATQDTHEMQFLRLAPGKTAADVLAWARAGLAGPPPITGAFGGAGALAPGGQMWVRFNLPPGAYVAVCFVPDEAPPHAPHLALGMVQGFQVR